VALDATRYARRGAVCTIDPLASSAGLAMLRAGGSAADAAVAARAVLAVTSPHMCGMGGDLLAVVHRGGSAAQPTALLGVGAAGSGVDAQSLRDEGHTTMPMQGDLRAVTVPGCVDGWLALHERFGRLPLADVLEPARGYAAEGFPVGLLLSAVLPMVRDVPAAADFFAGGAPLAGQVRRRPALARAIADIASDGRKAWYDGDFGRGLIELGRGQFTADDLARGCAEWTTPVRREVWGQTLHTTPAPTQGYLTLAHLAVLERLGDLPDPTDPAWAHLLIESARMSGADRPRRLYDGADPAALLTDEDVERWSAGVDREGAGTAVPPTGPGGTIFLCAVDGDGGAVSLGQSNASGFGAHLGVEAVGVMLHNRGIGFSLDPTSPALLRPGARPPHTLSPLLVTAPTGDVAVAAGTMGGDAQPQVLLQLLARLHAGATPGAALAAPRWSFASPGGGGFDIWGSGLDASPAMAVRLEPEATAGWAEGLRSRGHQVETPPYAGFGHAHLAVRTDDGGWAAAADPRAAGSAAIY
jgi:gamma-glutamyltranspeptidase/glutathione hydrolase